MRRALDFVARVAFALLRNEKTQSTRPNPGRTQESGTSSSHIRGETESATAGLIHGSVSWPIDSQDLRPIPKVAQSATNSSVKEVAPGPERQPEMAPVVTNDADESVGQQANASIPFKTNIDEQEDNIRKPRQLDLSQAEVIKEITINSVLCIAPPGHGKTATALSAIQEFIAGNPDTCADNIMLVSFSVAAIEEARARLNAVANCKSVKCYTVDSLAGYINLMISQATKAEMANASDYDTNILNALKHIQGFSSPLCSTTIREYIKNELDLVVIDEAQDIFGLRAQLLKELVFYLHEEAKCLIFGDPLQEIYDYTEQGEEESLLSWAQNKMKDVFILKTLRVNHRTSCPYLSQITAKARSLYHINSDSDRARQLLGLIEENGSLAKEEEYLAKPAGANTEGVATLFRRNVDALNMFVKRERLGKKSSLRLSYLPDSIDPIIGTLLWRFPSNEKVPHDTFWSTLDIDMIEAAHSLDSFGEAFDNIDRYYGSKESIDISKVLASISRNSVPSIFSRMPYGKGFDTISSIHSFKGRESSHINLFIPDEVKSISKDEFRVYYVGLTRAISSLATYTYKMPFVDYKAMRYSKRAYLPHCCGFEIGRNGDVVWSNTSKAFNIKSLHSSFRWLEQHAHETREVALVLNKRNSSDSTYDLIDVKAGRYLGCLSPWAYNDIYHALRKYGGLPSQMTGLYMVGCRTIITSDLYWPNTDSFEKEGIVKCLEELPSKIGLMPRVIGIAVPVG